MTRSLIAHLAEPRAADDGRVSALTPRERDVLLELAAGLTNAGIAARLGISATTVKTHVERVLMKLGLSSRAQAVVFAYESGLVRATQDRVPPPNGG